MPVLGLHRAVEFLVETIDLLDIPFHRTAADDLSGVEDTLDDEKYLRRVDRLHQIVVDFLPDGIVHQRFLFRFRDHDDREMRLDIFDFFQRGETVFSGHHFVQQDEIEHLFLNLDDGIVA